MKKLITHHLFDEGSDEETPKKTWVSNFLMSIFIVFTIALLSIIYSCAVVVPGPGGEGHGGNHEHHGQEMHHAEFDHDNHDGHHD
jgi:hypothetical protein